MSCACQLINYTLATEENVGNIPVCACCNRFPVYHNTQPNTFEYSHKVQVFQGKISVILPICIMKKNQIWKFRVNGIISVIGTRVNFTKFRKRGSPSRDLNVFLYIKPFMK